MTTDSNGITDAIVASEACETPETVPTVVANPQPTPEIGASDKCARSDIDFTWHEDRPPGPQTHELCALLASSGELYRNPAGELLWLIRGQKPRKIASHVELEGFIRYHWKVEVISDGQRDGFVIPSSHLKVLIKTCALQKMVKVVDLITDVPTYNSEMRITRPGYNEGPDGERIFYTGNPVEPKRDPSTIREFLGAMSFKDKVADASNLVGLALTVLLRHMFPGAKPFAVVTANRSHAGKDTALDFAMGRTLRREISYSHADWPMQNEAVAALSDPAVGFLTIGNIRAGSRIIESSFIERLVTDPKPLLQSSKRGGDGFERQSFVVGSSANQGRFSTDLMNRSLPVRLELTGNVEDRPTPLGDLRHEYLPAHKLEIEAELCGMIENWKDQGCPLDSSVKHPMKAWAQMIGGILKANGFEGFLSNWALEKSAQDCLTEALGLLANSAQQPAPGWMRVSEIVKIAVDEGIIADLIGRKHKMNEKAMERDFGVLLSGHRDECVHFETDDGVKSYRILRERKRQDGLPPAMMYMFDPVER
ncbi:MAG: hypothetical protein GX565_07945 [Lentisphaerae bacterium]|nr:hypothetical protein [Lentisphaerota bacterium]